jgi:hypothetical protein
MALGRRLFFEENEQVYPKAGRALQIQSLQIQSDYVLIK